MLRVFRLRVVVTALSIGASGCGDGSLGERQPLRPRRDGPQSPHRACYPAYPQISNHDATPIEVIDSTIE